MTPLFKDNHNDKSPYLLDQLTQPSKSGTHDSYKEYVAKNDKSIKNIQDKQDDYDNIIVEIKQDLSQLKDSLAEITNFSNMFRDDFDSHVTGQSRANLIMMIFMAAILVFIMLW